MQEELHRLADAATAQRAYDKAITLLTRCVEEDRTDFAAWLKLATLRRASGRVAPAMEAVDGALAARPNDVLGLLLKGSLYEQLGDEVRAAELYRASLFHAATVDHHAPVIEAQLHRVRAFLDQHRRALELRMTTRASLSGPHLRRADRFLDNVLDRRPVYHQAPTHYRYPGLPDGEFFDDAYPALLNRLRAATPAIQAEFATLMDRHSERQTPYVDFASGQPVGQWAGLNRSRNWNALHLLRYGERDPINAALCPATLAAFAGDHQVDVPDLSPNLMFSLLAPHTHIPPHHGVANFRLVVHLPLIVPPRCRFRVGSETRPWVAGEPWIFDDTIEHEAWNDSDQLRVVLIGDVWRPELDAVDRTIIRDFFRAQEHGAPIGAL